MKTEILTRDEVHILLNDDTRIITSMVSCDAYSYKVSHKLRDKNILTHDQETREEP